MRDTFNYKAGNVGNFNLQRQEQKLKSDLELIKCKTVKQLQWLKNKQKNIQKKIGRPVQIAAANQKCDNKDHPENIAELAKWMKNFD